MRPHARQAARAAFHPLFLGGRLRSKSSPKSGPETPLRRQEFSIRPRGAKPSHTLWSATSVNQAFYGLDSRCQTRENRLKRTSGDFRRREARVCRFVSRVTTEKIGMIGSCCHARQAENNERAWAAHGLVARGASTSSCGRRRRLEGGPPTEWCFVF